MDNPTLTKGWGILLLFAVLATVVIYSGIDVKRLVVSFTTFNTTNNLHIPNIQSERWIVVDGTNIPDDRLKHTEDVPDWGIIVFGKDSNIFKTKRCMDCVIVNANSPLTANLKSPSLTNIKMMAYLYAIGHGAKWIFITDQIVNLKRQVEDFYRKETVKGLLYTGQITFDPDRHFGVKDISANRTIRTNQLSYKLGEYSTPSVQSRWRLPEHVTGSKFDVNDVACRLPHVVVPAQFLPTIDLTGSIIEYRSFWVLGSLLSESKSSSLASWWLWLMRDVDEAVGIYPPLCGNTDVFVGGGNGVIQAMQNTLSGWKCVSNTFFTCGLLLAKEMESHGLIIPSDVMLVKQWIGELISLNFTEPIRNNLNLNRTRFRDNFKTNVHNVGLEIISKPYSQHTDNPFTNICKLQSQDKHAIKPLPPIRDILLIIIFNFPTLYSNILYLDNIYRRYFANIIYCGENLGKFSKLQQNYNRPISFLELSGVESTRGKFGYLCSAYAMEIGFRVSGYLQMSDDVLLNMWNIVSLPRDKSWFQSSIRKGNLSAPEVPNVTKINGKIWLVWVDINVGVRSLRRFWSHLTNLTKTKHDPRVTSLFKQLGTNFGSNDGAFYEASDIFYTPAKFKDNFSFFAKRCYQNRLHLEICVPTMLCGFDDINKIVRLNGTYLWYQQRKNYTQYYDSKHMFLHPWKLKELFTQAVAQKFFCTKYFPFLEDRND